MPPENKPTPAEINTCREFLVPTIAEMRNLRAIVALGRIAHETTVKALGAKRAAAAVQAWRQSRIGALALFSSYHCSRYNTNTGVLTPEMFRAVFAAVRKHLDECGNAAGSHSSRSSLRSAAPWESAVMIRTWAKAAL